MSADPLLALAADGGALAGRLAWTEEALRLAAAVLAGGVLGLNRNLRGKAAGLRTHALVALGAALVMIVTAHLTRSDAGEATRTVQGIITGIGFIGAGVILHPRQLEGDARGGVRGLTTAASVWVAAGLGTASGAGLWSLVLLATGLTLLVLMVGGSVEDLTRRKLGQRRQRRAARARSARHPGAPPAAPAPPDA